MGHSASHIGRCLKLASSAAYCSTMRALQLYWYHRVRVTNSTALSFFLLSTILTHILSHFSAHYMNWLIPDECSLQSLHNEISHHHHFKSNWKCKKKLQTWNQSLAWQHMRHTLRMAILNHTFTIKFYVNLLITWLDAQLLGVSFLFLVCLAEGLGAVFKMTHLIMHWPRILFCSTFGFIFFVLLHISVVC